MTVAVTPAMITLNTPVSHPTQTPPPDLQRHNKPMRLNEIPGQIHETNSPLAALVSPSSLLMLPNPKMIPYLTMGSINVVKMWPQPNIGKISISWNQTST